MTRWLRAWGFGILAVASATACGGRTEGDAEGAEPAPDPGTGSGSDEGSADGDGDGDEPARPPGSTMLGPCEPGFDPAREPTRRCDWIAEKRCYPTKLAACNCVCPRDDPSSVCSSGFFNGENGRTQVTCF